MQCGLVVNNIVFTITQTFGLENLENMQTMLILILLIDSFTYQYLPTELVNGIYCRSQFQIDRLLTFSYIIVHTSRLN